MIIGAKVTLILLDKPTVKPIGPTKCALEFGTRNKRGEVLLLRIKCPGNQRLDSVNEISEGNCELIVPKDPTKLTFTFRRSSQQILMSTLTEATKKNILFIVEHFLNGKHNSAADLVQVKRILCNATNPTTVAKVLGSEGPRKLRLCDCEAREDWKSRKAYPKSVEFLSIEGHVPLDLRPFALTNLRVLKLQVMVSVEKSKDMAYLMNLSRLTCLEELDLSRNGLADLPKKVYKSFPQSLRVLNLSKNTLSVVPEILTRFSNLIQLDLSDNVITEIHPNIYKLANLRDIRLHNNELEHLPLSLLFGKRFETISLYGNNFIERQYSLNVIPQAAVYQLQHMALIKLMNMGLKPNQIFPPEWKHNFFAHKCYMCRKYLYSEIYVEKLESLSTYSQNVVTYHNDGHQCMAKGFCCRTCFGLPVPGVKAR